MNPIEAFVRAAPGIALIAATLGLATCAAIALTRWTARRLQRLLDDAYNMSFDEEYEAFLEAEDA